MKRKYKGCNAYFTVEASLLFPIVFLAIMFLLYFGFFCYEKCVTMQSCYLAALRGSNEWQLSGKNLKDYVKKELSCLVDEKTLYNTEGNIKIHIGTTEIEVSFDRKLKFPFFAAEEKGDVSNKKKAIRNIPTVFIRRNHILKGVVIKDEKCD